MLLIILIGSNSYSQRVRVILGYFFSKQRSPNSRWAIAIHYKRESLDLVLLREIKVRALCIVSKALKEQYVKTNNAQEIQAFAISTMDWFDSLLDVILLIEQLPNPDSL